MVTYSAQAAPILRPEDVDALIIGPVQETSIAAQMSTTRTTASPKLRMPVMSQNPRARWVAEGSEIPLSDPGLTETVVEPSLLAGLTAITRQAATDTDPMTVDIVGEGLANDLAERIDEAFFGTPLDETDAPDADAPDGLAALTGFTTITTPTGVTTWQDLDAFIDAEYSSPVPITAYAAHSDDAKALAKLRTADASNQYLLPLDPNRPGQRTINGAPLYVSDYVTPGGVWGIPAPRSRIVIREDVEITSDWSVYFTSNKVAVRGLMRLAFGFPTPESIIRINLSTT